MSTKKRIRSRGKVVQKLKRSKLMEIDEDNDDDFVDAVEEIEPEDFFEDARDIFDDTNLVNVFRKDQAEEPNQFARDEISKKMFERSKSIFFLPFRSNVIVNGSTNTGKTTFVTNLFSSEFWSFREMPLFVYLYVKNNVQQAFSNLRNNCAKLRIKIETFTDLENIDEILTRISSRSVLIIDDFMVDAIKDVNLMRQLTDIFNVHTHHKDIITIITLHNLFAAGFRTIRLNSKFLFLFSSPVDTSSIKKFFQQVDNTKANDLFEAFKKIIQTFRFFGIHIQHSLHHKYYAGFENELLFLTPAELTDLRTKFRETTIENLNSNSNAIRPIN